MKSLLVVALLVLAVAVGAHPYYRSASEFSLKPVGTRLYYIVHREVTDSHDVQLRVYHAVMAKAGYRNPSDSELTRLVLDEFSKEQRGSSSTYPVDEKKNIFNPRTSPLVQRLKDIIHSEVDDKHSEQIRIFNVVFRDVKYMSPAPIDEDLSKRVQQAWVAGDSPGRKKSAFYAKNDDGTQRPVNEPIEGDNSNLTVVQEDKEGQVHVLQEDQDGNMTEVDETDLPTRVLAIVKAQMPEATKLEQLRAFTPCWHAAEKQLSSGAAELSDEELEQIVKATLAEKAKKAAATPAPTESPAGEATSAGEVTAQPEDEASAEEATTKPEDEAGAVEVTTKPAGDTGAEEATTKPEDEAGAVEATTKPEGETGAGEATAKPESESVAEEATAKPEEETGTEEATTKPEEEIGAVEATTKPEGEAGTEEVTTEPEGETEAEEVTTKPADEEVTDESENQTGDDAVTDQPEEEGAAVSEEGATNKTEKQEEVVGYEYYDEADTSNKTEVYEYQYYD